MPIEVEVEGAVIEFPEGTSEEEILSAIQSYSPEAVSEPSIAPDPGQPEPYQVPEGFLEQMEQQELTRRQMQAYYGPGPFSPSGPEAEFTKKLYGDFPKSIGHGLELAMKPIAFAVRPVFEQLRYATGPTTYGMTGEMPGPLKPGESVIEGLTAPGPDEKGIIPSLRHFSVGLSTPEMLAVMPFAPQSRILSGMFALGGAASIPPSLEALAQAETGAETRGALTDIGLGAMVTTGAGKAALRERMPHAGSQQEAATLYGDVLRKPGDVAHKPKHGYRKKV